MLITLEFFTIDSSSTPRYLTDNFEVEKRNLTAGFCFFKFEIRLELVSKELNHLGVIAGLFRHIGGL